jgi:heme exporter protein D
VSFQTLHEFLVMGGHGPYVWLAYLTTIAVVLANVLSVRFARRRYFRQARALERRRAAGTGSGPGNQTGSRMEEVR